MTKRTRRNHSGSFKAKVALAAARGQDAGRIGNSMMCIRTKSRNGSSSCWNGPPMCLRAVEGPAEREEPDLKVLHAKIGQLALENDFLSGALTKAGLLSAKR